MQPELTDIPDFLRIPQDERRKSWKGRKLTPSRVFATQHAHVNKPTDPGTIKLLAEIAAREKAEADRKAIAKEDARIIRAKHRTRDRAMLAAVAQLHLLNNPNATEGEIEMAKKAKTTKKSTAKARLSKALGRPLTEKTVTTRFKATPPKKAEALKKPAVVRAPRRAPDSSSSHNIKLSEIDKTLPAKVKAAKAADAPKAESKGAKLERILRAGKISVADIAEQLEWLPHTTRAAISRVGFEVTTEKKEGVTLYHIAKDAKAKAKADAA